MHDKYENPEALAERIAEGYQEVFAGLSSRRARVIARSNRRILPKRLRNQGREFKEFTTSGVEIALSRLDCGRAGGSDKTDPT